MAYARPLQGRRQMPMDGEQKQICRFFVKTGVCTRYKTECPFAHPDPQGGGGGGYGRPDRPAARPAMDNDFNDFRRKLRDDFQDRPFNVGRSRPAAIAAYDPEFPTGGPFDDYYEERSVRPARDAREFSQMLREARAKPLLKSGSLPRPVPSARKRAASPDDIQIIESNLRRIDANLDGVNRRIKRGHEQMGYERYHREEPRRPLMDRYQGEKRFDPYEEERPYFYGNQQGPPRGGPRGGPRNDFFGQLQEEIVHAYREQVGPPRGFGGPMMGGPGLMGPGPMGPGPMGGPMDPTRGLQPCFNYTKKGTCDRENCKFAPCAFTEPKDMCHSFRDTGTCKFGAKCKFTHGRNDIRKKLAKEKEGGEVPKGVCRFFFTSGKCVRYKSECPNSHPKGEKSGELGEKGLTYTKPEGWKMDEVEKTNGEAMDTETTKKAKKKPGPKSKTTENGVATPAAKKAPKKMGPKSKTLVKPAEEKGNETTTETTEATTTAKKAKKDHPPKGVCRFFFKFGKCERKKSACPMEHPNGKKTGEFSYVKDESIENTENGEESKEEKEVEDLELLEENGDENGKEIVEDVDMQILDDEETSKE